MSESGSKGDTDRRALTGTGAHRAMHQGARRDRQPRGCATSRARVGGRSYR